MRLVVAMFLATLVLLMRYVTARAAYADSFGWTFVRTARAAPSVRTRAYFLAMPRLRAQRICWLAYDARIARDSVARSKKTR